MLKICLVFWNSEPQYAYKRYAYIKKHVIDPGCIKDIVFSRQSSTGSSS